MFTALINTGLNINLYKSCSHNKLVFLANFHVRDESRRVCRVACRGVYESSLVTSVKTQQELRVFKGSLTGAELKF